MAQYVLEGRGDIMRCFHRKNTPLTGMEKSGENWPGARECGYMASSPSYRCWWLHHNPGLVNVSCSCEVCSAVLSLVCWSTEGERRCSGHFEQEILWASGWPIYTLSYTKTLFCNSASPLQMPVSCRAEEGSRIYWLCLKNMVNFLAFCLYYPMVPVDIRVLHSLLLYAH